MAAIPNYADRRRRGEPIASGLVESAANQAHIGCHRSERVCSINRYAATSSAGIPNFAPLLTPFALPRSTRNGPLSYTELSADRFKALWKD